MATNLRDRLALIELRTLNRDMHAKVEAELPKSKGAALSAVLVSPPASAIQIQPTA